MADSPRAPSAASGPPPRARPVLPYLSGGEGDYLARWKRLVYIDGRLRSGEWPSLRALAQACGVVDKTIRRDLEALRDELRAPVAFDRRRGGWGYSDPTFGLPAVLLSERDLFALMVAEQALAQYEGTPLHGRLREAFDKILAHLGPEARAAHQRVARSLHFGGLPPPRVDPDTWTALLLAIERHEEVELDYRKIGARRAESRRLQPCQLLARERDWFLLAHDPRRRLHRLYYLPRIRAVRPTGTRFEPDPAFDPQAFHRAGFNLMQGPEAPVEVVLRFAPAAADLAAERDWADGQTTSTRRDGSVVVRFRSAALFEIERQVLRYGGVVEVLAPKGLRESVAETARRIARGHGG